MSTTAIQRARRVIRIVFGFSILALGLVMILTPGPGLLTIFLALGVLGAEFVWARRLLDKLKQQHARIRETIFPPADPAA